MKYYDYKKVKTFIEKHKNIIESVSLGMHEDWFWTGQLVYENGEFLHSLPDNANELEELFLKERQNGLSMFLDGLKINPKFNKMSCHRIGGIFGSRWATPVMKVIYCDGTDEFIECSEGSHSVDDIISRIEQEIIVTENLGELSKPVQDNIKPITRNI